MTQTKKHILVADSGSTKTDWAVVSADGHILLRAKTQGINPFMLSSAQIVELLSAELLPAIDDFMPLERVAFYGAGCRPEVCANVADALRLALEVNNVAVASDLLGATRALCGHGEGIACILGTGSNSCLYNGAQIASNVPSLGFILGDEGSGAVLGRLLIGELMKGDMPEGVQQSFREFCPGGIDEVIRRVYKEQFPNRYLASFVPLLHRHRHEPQVSQLLHKEFCRFFRRNTCRYRRPDLDVNFVGSIAAVFEAEVRAAAIECGQRVGTILRAPLDGLCSFETECPRLD